jgi:hypothetical protein
MFLFGCKNECWPDCSDWIMLCLGAIVSIGWALYIYIFLRPKLEIGLPTLSKVDNRSILVPITNKKKSRKATRIKIELTVIDTYLDTYHLVVLEDDFAFLAPKECREFKAYKLNEYLESYSEIQLFDNVENKYDAVLDLMNMPKSKLRVRIHATDSFSGLGETFEEEFISIDRDFKKNGFITKQKQS